VVKLDAIEWSSKSDYAMLVSLYERLPVTAGQVGRHPNGLEIINAHYKVDRWLLTIQSNTAKNDGS
jgi:hypothetical protein